MPFLIAGQRGCPAYRKYRSMRLVVIVAAMEISTSSGPATAVVDDLGPGRTEAGFLLVLTHGAGGGMETRDLLAASRAAREAGAVAVRVLQPYRVRGARAPGSAERQDAAWLEIIAVLRERFPGIPLIQGGRSNGARVACRTAQAAGAAGVIALAFPLHPPGRGGSPEHSRAGELRDAGVPVLVINGASDPFGIPDAADADQLVVLPGETHALSRGPKAVGVAVASWLPGVLARVTR